MLGQFSALPPFLRPEYDAFRRFLLVQVVKFIHVSLDLGCPSPVSRDFV